jgi:pimeloyl-ACP methyl ester carboxylesterase
MSLETQGQVARAVSILLAKFGDEIETITTTGHSLGGALATLCAFDLVASGANHVGAERGGALIPVTAYTFESPRVGAIPARFLHASPSSSSACCALRNQVTAPC